MSSPKKSPKKQRVVREDPQYEHLTADKVEIAHETTVTYLLAQHKEVVQDLRRDNAMLREENDQLK